MRLVLFFILFPALAGAFQLDWSGQYLARIAYLRGGVTEADLNDGKGPVVFYGRQQLTLNSTARISDGLSFRTNFLLGSVNTVSDNWEKPKKAEEPAAAVAESSHTHPYRPKFYGPYRAKNRFQSTSDSHVHFVPSHFYFTYSNEFLKADVGRQPFHFGQGMTYHDGAGPFFYPAYDVLDAVSFQFQHESFYLKPYAIIYSQVEFPGSGAALATAAGWKTDNITAEVLYKSGSYAFQTKKDEDIPKASKCDDPKSFEKERCSVESSTLNVHAEYKEGPLTAAVEWGMKDNDMKKSAGLALFTYKTDFYNTNLNLLAIYAGDYYVNLNMDNTAFLTSGLYTLSDMEKPEDAKAFPENTFNLVPFVSFDLMEKHTVIVGHAWMSDQDTLQFKSHDFFVLATHKITKGFTWNNMFAALLEGASVSDVYFRTQAAVAF